MIELFALALVTLAIVLYGQARITARDIRRNRADAAPMPSIPPMVRVPKPAKTPKRSRAPQVARTAGSTQLSQQSQLSGLSGLSPAARLKQAGHPSTSSARADVTAPDPR